MKPYYFLLIFVVLIFLVSVIYLKFPPGFKNQSTENIVVENDSIYLDSLTLEQKIAQMIIVRGDSKNLDFNSMNVGGIFLDRQGSAENYKSLIADYQNNSDIKLFVATDLEGAWTPFTNSNPNHTFPKFSEINSSEEAYNVGLNHGILLEEIGFNLNFAPVAELSDNAYGGRAFEGSNQEIRDKISKYIEGLQKNVFGTCKHYPGNSLQANLHNKISEEEISKEDLELFEECINKDIFAIMVSHHSVKGEIDSKGKPSTVSKEVLKNLEDFEGLVISDEINMVGLKHFYPSKKNLYVDLINSGENLILDFEENPESLYRLIKKIKKEVEEGRIDQKRIDDSVKKILTAKGYNVV